MARARNIKPALFKNELLGVADPYITLLFQSLWMLADREGRLEDRPLRIKAETFPYREGLDINGYLTELQRLGFIVRYSVDGDALIQVVNFKKHQAPHKTEKPSELPSVEAGIVAGCGFAETAVNAPLNNGEKTEALPPDLLIPDLLIPDCPILIPDSKTVATALRLSPPEKKEPKPKSESVNAETWDAYSNAYFDRYGTEPVRNAKVNAGIAQFVQRLGKDEAPHVARFFVGHGNGYYVREMHAVGPMLKDAEKLRTEWATNSRMTAHKAMQSDRTQTNFDSFGPLIAAAQSREEIEKQQEANHGE